MNNKLNQYINIKYAEKEVGKQVVDNIISKMKKYAKEDCFQDGIFGGTLVSLLDNIVAKRKDVLLDYKYGITTGVVTAISSGAFACSEEYCALMSMGVAGAICGTVALINYIKDKREIKEVTADLRKYLNCKFADVKYPEMSKRSIDACLNKACEELALDYERGDI